MSHRWVTGIIFITTFNEIYNISTIHSLHLCSDVESLDGNDD